MYEVIVIVLAGIVVIDMAFERLRSRSHDDVDRADHHRALMREVRRHADRRLSDRGY